MAVTANMAYVAPNPEPMIITPVELLAPPGRRFWTEDLTWPIDKRGNAFPSFQVSEVGKVFFGRKVDWVRWRTWGDDAHPNGWVLLDGKPLDIARTAAGTKKYTLLDVEMMAHALAQNGCISGEKLGMVVTMVKLCARLHGHSL